MLQRRFSTLTEHIFNPDTVTDTWIPVVVSEY